jgi:quinol monooxygenase YgiN
MEMFIFGRFHARSGNEANVAKTLTDVLLPSRAEPECININAFRSKRDPQVFFIHARWKDEKAFDKHIKLPHTIEFVRRMEPLIDHPLELTRTKKIG